VSEDEAIYLFPSCGETFDRFWFRRLFRDPDILVTSVSKEKDSLLPPDKRLDITRHFNTKEIRLELNAARYSAYGFCVERQGRECWVLCNMHASNPHITLNLSLSRSDSDQEYADSMELARVIWSSAGAAMVLDCEGEDGSDMDECLACVDGKRVLFWDVGLRWEGSILLRAGEPVPVGIKPNPQETVGGYTRHTYLR
jgi:hypothetical protein